MALEGAIFDLLWWAAEAIGKGLALCKGRSLQLIVSIPFPFSPEEMIPHHNGTSDTGKSEKNWGTASFLCSTSGWDVYLAVPMLSHGFWLILHIFWLSETASGFAQDLSCRQWVNVPVVPLSQIQVWLLLRSQSHFCFCSNNLSSLLF